MTRLSELNPSAPRINRYALLIYFILAYTFAWILYPLMTISPLYGIPGLFAPALAAILVSWLTGGRPQVGELLHKLAIWRVGILWYLIALGLPLALSFLVAVLAGFLSAGWSFQLAPITPLALVVFVLVVGEEIGWRGYGQPQLERRFSPLLSAIILGVLWGFWHLPNFFIPGLPHTEIPLAAFVLYTIAFSILAAWILKHTQGSMLIATLFHGAYNTFGFLPPSLAPAMRWWLMAIVYSAAALLVALIYGVSLSRSRSTESPDPSAASFASPEA